MTTFSNAASAKHESKNKDEGGNDQSRSAALHSLLRERFGLSSFRKGQLSILLSVLSGRDTLAVMPTGGGKSLCYQLPALHFNGLVIVISPLISLMQDQVRLLRGLGIPAGCLYSGQALEEKQAIFREMRKGGTFILYLSPERVQKPGFAPWFKEQKVALVAIDESHCVSQWGPEFRQDYNRLPLLREWKPAVPMLALTATATPEVLRDIAARLQLKTPDKHVYGFYRPNLFYQVETCEDDEAKLTYLIEAIRQRPDGRILVYCGTRRQCEEITVELRSRFDDVEYYHAGMTPDDRTRVQKDYETGKVRILAATNAFGMGMDYPDVRLVVHMQMPASIEAYYQEVGRAGRDGQRSLCLFLYAKKDRSLQIFFIRESKADQNVIRARWRSLDALTQFIEGGECRHAGILTYFRDTERIVRCGHCDICTPRDPWRVAKPRPSFIAAPKVKVRKGRKEAAAGADDELPLTPEQETRMLVLKEWRKNYAQENDIAAFIVFSNRTLYDLARKAPRTADELARVYGFGANRISQIGELVLAQIRQLD